MTLEEIQLQIQNSKKEQANGNYERSNSLAEDIRKNIQINELTPLNIVEQYIEALIIECWNYDVLGYSELALSKTSEALQLSEEYDFKKLTATANYNFGSIYNGLSNYEKALEYYTISLLINEEIGNKAGIANTKSNIGTVFGNLSEKEKALQYYTEALSIHEQLQNKIGIASVNGNMGFVYGNLNIYDRAIECFSKSLIIFEEIGQKQGIATATNNIGTIYRNLKDNEKALEYYTKALLNYEEMGNKLGIALATMNIGTIYGNEKNYEKSLEYYSHALLLYEETKNIIGIAITSGNMGLIFKNFQNYEKSLEYNSRALLKFEEIGNKQGVANAISSIGILYATKSSGFFDNDKAEEYLLKSNVLAIEVGAKEIIQSNYHQLHILRLEEHQYEEALVYYKKSVEVGNEIQSEDAIKKAQEFDQRRKIEEDEKARQVNLARFQEQERIFHNILPISIANRLIDGEKTIAESFPNVSIFFSDIVGFTTLSSIIDPSELVSGLNTIFTAFDRIGTKYGLEKIKTIGDAYMAVCGLPEQFEDNAMRTAKFAFEANEILASLQLSDNFKDLQFRIGLHCGSVVAGIIGEKKFAYDVWGDAVNVASRMESNSEAGRIHISEQFAKSIEQYLEFSLVPRGEITIKGKGTMKTFWLEKA